MISDKEWSKILTLMGNKQLREGPEPFPPIAAWSALKNDNTIKKAWKEFFAEALPFEIYAHIPFCNSICLFCNVRVRRVAPRADIERYVNSLESEINAYGRLYPRGEAQKIFIGGGTPNLLRASEIKRLLLLLKKNFRVKRSAEIIMEINPEYMDNERLKVMKACGVTVLSFGVESLNADTIGALGRTQTVSTVKSTYLRCRKAGFKRIIVDIIAGLPHQGAAEFLKTLLELASWRPDEICMETFSPEGTLFSKKGGSITDAQRRENENLIQRGFKMMNSIGYHHRANESFASLRKNEQGCRTYRSLFDHRTVLGLGLGSLSHIWGHYYSQNTADEREYSRLVSGDSLPAAFAAAIKTKDEKISYIINSLSRGWISRDEYFRIFREPIEKGFKKQIAGLSDRGLIYLKGKSYCTVRPDRAEYDCSRFFYDTRVIKRIRLRDKVNH